MSNDVQKNLQAQLFSAFRGNPYGIIKIRNNSQESINEAINILIKKLKWEKIVSSYNEILIKPNFTIKNHKPGVTTSPKVLRAIIEKISGWGKDITVIEGNGGSWLFDATEAAKNHGVMELEKDFGVKWINISELSTKIVKDKILGNKVSLELPEKICRMNKILISIPVFKNHCMTRVSLGIKNLWGLIPSEMRMLNHSKHYLYLPLISKYYNHQLTLIDGTIGLKGNGPMYGDPIELNTFFAGNNPALSDIIGSCLMKVNPQIIKHISVYSEINNIVIEDLILHLQNEIKGFQKELKMIRTPSNYLDLITFKSYLISKIVFDSPFTSMIYFLFNRVNGDRISIPPKKLRDIYFERFNG